MQPETTADLVKLIASVAGNLSVPVVLVFILIGGFRRWWVWGWMYDQKEAENTYLRAALDKQIDLSGRGVAVAQRILTDAPPRSAAAGG